MRKLLLFLLLLLSASFVNAQKEFWGTGNPLGPGIYQGYEEYSNPGGWIYKTDSIGENIQILHQFDNTSNDGSLPNTSLIQATNGNLYGTTIKGGDSVQGVLFEYDLAADTFKVRAQLGMLSGSYGMLGYYYKLIEVHPGLLLGNAMGGSVFAYNYITDSLYKFSEAPTYHSDDIIPVNTHPALLNLFKSSNGNLYVAQLGVENNCPPFKTAISKINQNSGTYSILYTKNDCTPNTGFFYHSDFIEKNGELYSIASGGVNSGGIIYSFDMANNSFQKKYDLPQGDSNGYPTSIIKASNNLLYGTTVKDIGSGGFLFEYDLTSNQFQKLYDFQNNNNHLSFEENGKLYGTTSKGVFMYDIASDSFSLVSPVPNFGSNPMIEICRKPFFKYSDTTHFELCEGSHFDLDLKCNNADSIVWKRNGGVVPTFQTSKISFDSITAAQSGTWQAEMINECGSTLSPVFQIAVNSVLPSTITSVISPDSLIEICPLDSTVLNGNNGGVWSTGENTSSITVSTPGTYQIINTNSCGLFYSNKVTIDTIFIPRPVISTNTSSYLCKYDSIVLTSSIPGMWNTGDTGTSIKISAEPDNPYYLWSQNQCRTDTSNILSLASSTFYPYEPKPEITNPQDSITICSSDSVLLTSNINSNYNSYSYAWIRFDGTYNYPAGPNNSTNNVPSIYAKQEGAYFLRQNSPCGKYYYSDTVTISIDNPITLQPIYRTYKQGNITLCEGDTVKVFTYDNDGIWNTGSSSDTINATQNGDYYYTFSNSCGLYSSDTISLNFVENNVDLTLPISSICVASGDTSIVLTGGSPAGYYGGQAVVADTFKTSLANYGPNEIIYTSGNMSCTFTKTATITIDTLVPNKPPFYYGVIGSGSSTAVLPGEVITLCNNQNIILAVDPWLIGHWNTGSTSTNLIAPSAGKYYFTAENGCGSATSDTLTINNADSINISFNMANTLFCKNDSSIVLNNVLPIGGTFSGNGIIGNQFDPTVAGVGNHTITYTATDSLGCSGTATNVVSVTDTPNKPSVHYQIDGTSSPVVAQPGETVSLCNNQNITIFVDSSLTGNWNTGLNSTVLSNPSTGEYYFTVQNSCGSSNSDTLTINNADSIPISFIMANTSFCENDSSIVLSNVLPIGGTFSGNGIIGNQFDPTVAGVGNHTITYTATDSLGCSGTATSEVSVAVTPNQPIISQNNDSLIINSNYFAYQWINCANDSVILGATSSYFLPFQDGLYAVEVRNSNGCIRQSSCFNYTTVGIEKMENDNFIKVYPIPATEKVVIETKMEIEKISIYNELGQFISSQKLANSIDISIFSRGIYFLKIKTNNGSYFKKIIKE